MFLEYLDRIAHLCLLIFDKLDNPAINLAHVPPRCDHRFIIVTTRNPTQVNLSPNVYIKVDIMTLDETIDAFLRVAFSPLFSLHMQHLEPSQKTSLYPVVFPHTQVHMPETGYCVSQPGLVA
jgi:hypothetical protein